MMTLTLLKSTAETFCWVPCNNDDLMFCDDCNEVMNIWQEYLRGDVSFSKHYTRRCMMSACLIIGDANLGHWTEEMSAGFLHCEVTIFPFVNKK